MPWEAKKTKSKGKKRSNNNRRFKKNNNKRDMVLHPRQMDLPPIVTAQHLAELMGVKFTKLVYLMSASGATTLIDENADLSRHREVLPESQIEADEAELAVLEYNSSRYHPFILLFLLG